MRKYWVTFRLKDNASYQVRYQQFIQSISDVVGSGSFWEEPTSFIAFESEYSTDQIASHIKKAIEPSTDVALLCQIGFDDYRLIGTAEDNTVYDLFRTLKKV